MKGKRESEQQTIERLAGEYFEDTGKGAEQIKHVVGELRGEDTPDATVDDEGYITEQYPKNFHGPFADPGDLSPTTERVRPLGDWSSEGFWRLSDDGQRVKMASQTKPLLMKATLDGVVKGQVRSTKEIRDLIRNKYRDQLPADSVVFQYKLFERYLEDLEKEGYLIYTSGRGLSRMAEMGAGHIFSEDEGGPIIEITDENKLAMQTQKFFVDNIGQEELAPEEKLTEVKLSKLRAPADTWDEHTTNKGKKGRKWQMQTKLPTERKSIASDEREELSELQARTVETDPNMKFLWELGYEKPAERKAAIGLMYHQSQELADTGDFGVAGYDEIENTVLNWIKELEASATVYQRAAIWWDLMEQYSRGFMTIQELEAIQEVWKIRHEDDTGLKEAWRAARSGLGKYHEG